MTNIDERSERTLVVGKEIPTPESKMIDAGLRRADCRFMRYVEMFEVVGIAAFMSVGAYLSLPGIYLYFIYGACALFSFLLIRTLRGVVCRRPDIGSLSSYVREYAGASSASIVSKLMRFDQFIVVVFDVTVVFLFARVMGQFWLPLQHMPEDLLLIFSVAAVMVGSFGERRLSDPASVTSSLIKAGVPFLVLCLGACIVTFRVPLRGAGVEFSMIKPSYAVLSAGILPAIAMIQTLIFSHGSSELAFHRASEEVRVDGRRSKRSARQIVVRLVTLSVGVLIVVAILLAGKSAAGNIDRFSAILGCVGIYATGRILRSLALTCSPRAFLAADEEGKGAGTKISVVLAGCATGLVINKLTPSYSFEIVLSVVALVSVGVWLAIVTCRHECDKRYAAGESGSMSLRRRRPLSLRTAALGAFTAMIALVALDYPVGTAVMACASAGICGAWLFWCAAGLRSSRSGGGELG